MTRSRETSPHDFRRTETLERVHHHAIGAVFEAFARTSGASLSAVLRQPCTLALQSMEQVTWEDLAVSFGEGTHFFTFSLPPLAGTALLTLPTVQALAMVDLRLAGTGEEEYPDRVLTEIEQELLAPVISGLLDELAKTLARLQATTPKLGVQESNIQFVTVASASEMCLAARFSFELMEREPTEIVLCLPFTTVRQLVEVMYGRPSGDGTTPSERFARQRLQEVPLELILQFPSFTTTPKALLNLGVGDELHLGFSTDRPLEVRAEGVLVALATIGRSGVRKACSITEEVL